MTARLACSCLAAQCLAAVAGQAEDDFILMTSPFPGETVFVENVLGIISIPDASHALLPVAAGFEGVDTSRTPLIDDENARELIEMFLDQPMSFGSADRLCIAIRTWLRVVGHPFVMVYLPPQDVTDGVIQIVVQPARLAGDLTVEGSRWFSDRSYLAALPVTAGTEIDSPAVDAALYRLNRNPYRQVAVAAAPGDEFGTTRLTLQVQEVRPWEITAGYGNTGTAVTGEHRVSAGAAWGNAFGRGDQLGYSFSADPRLKHSKSHSANYSTVLRPRYSLTVFGSWSELESDLPAPLTQEGKTWQAGARLGVPLITTFEGWERNLTFAADFKYSDNTLEFARIPITDNVTHIAQLGATFSASRRQGMRATSVSASLHASPGGLTNRNKDAAFGASRSGAKAAYAYGRLDGHHTRRFLSGYSWSTAAGLQAGTGPLLGSEQFNGGGSAGVRGYRESSAFGDDGALLTNQLHLPAFSPARGRDQADVFAFLDAAVLNHRGPGGGTTELASAGLGLNYRFGRTASLRAAYGRQLKELPNIAGGRSGRGHISANVSW